MSLKRLIYLADLTHTGQSVASNVFPLAIGLLASYVDKQLKGQYAIELFKYPEDLNAALNKKVPALVGFSNYSWNCHLSYQFASRIKKAFPETIVLAGGPNYGLTALETADFWRRFPAWDFYIVKEGEEAFVRLLELLERHDFKVNQLKDSGEMIPNAHYFNRLGFQSGDILPRVKDLQELGSPYLKGYMDKFFDGVLIPMIHTTRGCPFTCTFCTEGNIYYNKVSQRYDLKEELEYIAQRRKGVQDLLITDANFGMYNEDIDKARIIHHLQQEHGWPKRIIVSTGKNKKERILEVASILDGALSLTASLQSTDQQVLKNINRQNISVDALNEMVLKAKQAGASSYTELILCLPGDTVATHVQSLKDAVDSALDTVRMYQLILLPQTEMNTPQSRQQYGLQTRFRINPRSFGIYRVFEEEIVSVESEEIVVASNTLSAEEYIKCRELDFTVEYMHNTQMFIELSGLCRFLGISWFDFIYSFYQKSAVPNSPLGELYSTFKNDMAKGGWTSLAELEAQAAQRIQPLLQDSGGTNEMVKGKALAFFRYFALINQLVFAEFSSYLQNKQALDEKISLYLHNLERLNFLRKKDFLELNSSFGKMVVHFDFTRLAEQSFIIDPRQCFVAEGISVAVQHSVEQQAKIASYVSQYGKNVEGLGRILMRAPVAKLFREIISS